MNRTAFAVRVFTSAVAAGGLLALSACNTTPASTGPINVALAYHSDSYGGQMIRTGNKVFVAVTDDRMPDPAMAPAPSTMPAAMPGVAVIGQNTQGATPVSIFDTGTSPVDFVKAAMMDQLTKSGVTVVPSAGSADRVVKVSIKTFEAIEAGNYKANVAAVVTVTDTAGKPIGVPVSETADDATWGHSREPADYQQVLNKATINLVQSILQNAMFVQELTMTQ